MSRTLEQMDRELDFLKAEIEALKHREHQRIAAARELEGCFTGDAEWAAIHERIEEGRRQPDPDLLDAQPPGE